MTVQGDEPLDRYGGWKAHQLGVTGRFALVDWQGSYQDVYHKRSLWYAERPRQPRTGIRMPDYSDRRAMLETYRRLHPTAYRCRAQTLESKG